VKFRIWYVETVLINRLSTMMELNCDFIVWTMILGCIRIVVCEIVLIRIKLSNLIYLT